MSKKFACIKHLFILVLIVSIESTQAQVLYQGNISDVGTNEAMGNVKVDLMDIGHTTFSNSEGNFVFLDQNQNTDSTMGIAGSILTQGNILIWSFNTQFNLKIFSQTGSLNLSADMLPPDGYITLNGFRNGMYFLQVNSPKGAAIYKLVSISNNFIVSVNSEVDQHQGTNTTLDDTITFFKEGYYPLKKAVFSEDRLLRIKMLKKKYEELHFFNELVSSEAFKMISGTPSKTQFGEVASVKLIYDTERDLIFYMNTKLHTNHYYFAHSYMDFRGDQWTFNYTQYTNNPQRYLFPATLNYFSGLDIYTIEFFPGDEASCDEAYRLFYKIQETSFIGDQLLFYATNPSWEDCDQVPRISPNEIYAGQNYQALSLAESFGYLRKVDVNQLEDIYLNRHDIIILNGIPIDIAVVAGIITSEFQTPLSHINVLSHNRGTPNMALRDALSNPKLDSLMGKLVYLKVESDSFTIRSATLAEAEHFWSATEPQDTVYLEMDALRQGLINLDEATINEVKTIGGKAANYAELINVFQNQDYPAPVPEGYFAIPFHYYLQHIQQYGLDEYIVSMLGDPEFYTDSELRNEKLKVLRDSIVDSPLASDLYSLVKERLSGNETFTTFRFRSSTNAEDLEGFNGAGLYSSYTGSANDESRPFDEAIKKVWSSLWNFRAFEERSYFKIAHETCAMGILVHRSFPDEEANGVAITRNLYNSNHGFIINVQHGEHSIVNPEPGVLHDQIILYLFSLSGDDPFTIEYISHSNMLDPWQESVLAKEELFKLGDYLKIIKSYFYNYVYTCNCNYEEFGLDIEFKVDSEQENRKIYIKQVRPY